MIKTFFVSAFFICTTFVTGKNYTPWDDGSAVKFKIKNLGISVEGFFKGLQGNIYFDPADIAATKMEVTVDANTVNTGIKMRDNHLRKPEYFDVSVYPLIRFASVEVVSTGKNSYNVKGNLTIKNITKLITFPFSVVPKDGGFLFTGSYKINRRDYGVGGRSITMSDNLEVYLSVYAKQ